MIIKGLEFSESYDFAKFLDKHKKTQVFDMSLFVSKRHIEHCAQQALKAFVQGRNISKSVEIEFLLCLTREKQVNKALGKVQVKKRGVFVSWNSSWNESKQQFKFKEIQLKDKPDLDAIERSATFWVKQ